VTGVEKLSGIVHRPVQNARRSIILGRPIEGITGGGLAIVGMPERVPSLFEAGKGVLLRNIEGLGIENERPLGIGILRKANERADQRRVPK
jgi:hypothetical protein